MESQEWYLNNSKYIEQVDEGDWMALIVAVVMTILCAKGYPERFSPMNRRGAPDTWKVGMLVLCHVIKSSYGMSADILGSMNGVLRLGGLDRHPEASTLRKFSYRLPEGILDEMILETARLATSTSVIVAVDGTGFLDTNASPHYVKRIRQMSKDKPADISMEGLTYCCTAVRGFPKATLVGDVGSLCVYVCDVVTDHSADVTRMATVVDAMADSGIGIDYLLADKGYDAEYVHRYVQERLECTAVIPVRSYEPARIGHPEQTCLKGFNRNLMAHDWDEVYYPIYRFRGLIECINSIIKRLFGGEIRSRKDENKKKEIRMKCLAHNLWRMKELKLMRFANV
jgi:hypothetical protein